MPFHVVLWSLCVNAAKFADWVQQQAQGSVEEFSTAWLTENSVAGTRKMPNEDVDEDAVCFGCMEQTSACTLRYCLSLRRR